MDNEYNYPTVKRGANTLLIFTGAIVTRILIFGATNELVAALGALLTAVSATHAVLVMGGGFNNSRWASPPAGMTEETTTKKTVAPAIAAAQDVDENQ